MEWVPAWEAGGYYKEAPEETAYAVQEGPPITPIQPAHIPWFAPKYMATTVPLRRVAPSAAAVPAPQNACFNRGDVGHYAPNCPHPRRQRGFVLLCKNCAQVNQVELSPDEKDEDDEWPDEETMLNLEKESGRCVELEETCRGLRISNENVQKVTVDLVVRLEKSREAYEAASKRSERLIITAEKQEKMHIEELAKLEARRAEEARIAEELRGKIAEAKTAEEDLRSKISEIEAKCEMEFRRAEELSASMLAGNQKHEEELKDWAKKLADCESAKSLEVKCKLKVESDCRRLRKQLGKAEMR
ncbi:hypothetical protein AXG93_1646s1000 [Marchantia polymorpha subsp. ruderalis]|uniref:CCHC-type domain-containing protein n=1 Tax=Marchantia polymorpha subsp. ruderalis TaxID=1480154 RepID=A0A176WM62_MARPO|nr:hypothetical protein AXG93_1646s1000 [Marchantia polymorpha subsp. ruderalis]